MNLVFFSPEGHGEKGSAVGTGYSKLDWPSPFNTLRTTACMTVST